MKVCFKCLKEKELNDFYKHSQMSDGHLSKCKDCTKADTKKRTVELSKNPDWVAKEKERSRLKYHRLNYKNKHKPTYEQKKKAMQTYNDKFPEKMKAQIKSQRMKPEVKGNHLHHWSYNEQHYQDVIELSIKDHNTVHRFTIYDQERKMYRTLEGVLLDTKEKAVEYYESVI